MGDLHPGLHFGPYADGEPAAPLLGQDVAALEASRLFTAAGVRMRRMTAGDRIYQGEHTDYLVQVDADRRVVSILATLLPPDQDAADEWYRVTARQGEGQEVVALSYQWAMLIHFAHEVLALAPADAELLLNNLYRDGFLPRTFGDIRLAFVAGQRFGGGRALCLLAALADEEVTT